MAFAHCKGIDWYTELRRQGAIDCFAGTKYDGTANSSHFAKPPGSKANVEALFCSYTWHQLVSKQSRDVDATNCC